MGKFSCRRRDGGSDNLMNIDISAITGIAVKAGLAILEVYKKDFDVEYKDDRSPLTAADKASHEIIQRELLKLYPEIPVLSEEGKGIPYEERKDWERFWLVDPLDGTKEFIKRNGEFTVNIALIEGNRPVVGVIYIPVEDRLFYGIVGEGAWCRNGKGDARPIHVRETMGEEGLVVVQSRSHPSEDLKQYLEKLDIKESIARGSSLKLCAVADGSADILSPLGADLGVGYRCRPCNCRSGRWARR